MTVSNGQLANQTTFNSSFMSREIDTDTAGKVDLLNADSLSGASVINTQRVINSIASAMGITTAEVYDYLFTWIADYVGSPNDTVKQRINALVLKFADSGGHAHTGVDGDADQISATDLVNINQLFAEWQAFTTTGVTGSSTDVSSLFTAKSNAGSSISAGVITAGQNKCVLFNPTTGEQFEDAGGQKVYGRITWAASVWTLSYYTNEAGTETAYSFGSSTDIEFYFLEVFTLATRPTIPSTPEFGSLDITGDVVDATTTQRGVVNTVAQVFAGLKQFNSGVTIDSLIQLLLTTDSVTTGAAQTIPTPDPVILLTNASLTSVSGFTSDAKSRFLVVINKTGNDISLLHEDAGASAIDRVLLPNAIDMTWRNDEAFPFIYDTVNSRWNLSSGSGSPFLLQPFGTTPNSDGASYNSGTGEFNLEPADETNPGGISTAQQRMLGLKGFDSGFGTLGAVDSTSTGSDVTLPWTNGYVKVTDSSLDSITMIDEPTEIAAILFLTNETGNAITIKNEAGATAAKRILTGTGDDFTLETSSTVSFIYDTDSSRWRMSSGTGSGSGGGVKNLITNGNADDSASSIFIPYADAAGTRPVDGTGGSPTVTTSVTTTTPLDGTKSYLLTKPASNVQGQGWAVPFTVDPAYRAKSLKISADYIVNSGTFVAGGSGVESDVIWYIYDVTNSQLIEPSNIKMFSNNSSIADKFEATFQSSATGSSYRLIAHVQSTSASAFELKVDNITVSPQSYVFGTPVTDWSSFTPTFTGFGTVTNVSFWWRRNGDSVEIRGKCTPGTRTATEARVSLPSGLVSDSTKVTSVQSAGHWWDGNPLVAHGAVLIESGVSYVTFGSGNAGNNAFGKINGSSINNSSGDFAFEARVPVAGWSSSVQTSDNADTRVVAARIIQGNAQSIPNNTTTQATFASASLDTHSGVTGNTYKVPVSGIYRVVAANSYGNNTVGTRVNNLERSVNNGGSWTGLATGSTGTNAAGQATVFCETVISLNAGDLIRNNLFQNSGGSLSTVSDGTQNYMLIERLSGPSAIAASETVACKYYSSGGVSHTTSVATLIPFDNKVFDTHNAFDTATGKFTAPVAGFYQVNSTITFNGGTSNGRRGIFILKNGGADSFGTFFGAGGSTNGQAPHASDIFYLKAGEFIQIQGFQDSGGALTTTNDAAGNFISIARIK